MNEEDRQTQDLVAYPKAEVCDVEDIGDSCCKVCKRLGASIKNLRASSITVTGLTLHLSCNPIFSSIQHELLGTEKEIEADKSETCEAPYVLTTHPIESKQLDDLKADPLGTLRQVGAILAISYEFWNLKSKDVLTELPVRKAALTWFEKETDGLTPGAS